MFLKKLNAKYKSLAALSTDVAQIFIKTAHKKFHKEGTLEIDLDKKPLEQVTTAESIPELQNNGGLWVKAWVWVSNDDLSDEDNKKVFGK